MSLYTNGVAFIELAGTVHGDAVVRLDLASAQLNDALTSLTAWDLNGGTVTGNGFHTAPSLSGQIHSLLPNLGPNPSTVDVLRALKGKTVEVGSGKGVVTGRILNVEVRTDTPPPAFTGLRGPMTPSPAPASRRFLSLVSDKGSIRSVELTPTTEVRVLGRDGQALTRTLHLVDSESAHPDLCHLTLEDRGTGARELHVSYLTQAPAWKSTYRVLFEGKGSDKAALQGWAVIDNTSADDWKNVDITLVSGAPQSFIQQISRPLTFRRQQVPMPQPGVASHGPYLPLGALADPLSATETTATPNSAFDGGGGVVERRIARVAPAQPTPDSDTDGLLSLPTAPATTSDQGDLFEFHLSKPITIASGRSLTVPILQTQLAVERVTAWSPHKEARPAMHALYFTNASGLTLDRGSVTVLEGNSFAGEGELDLTHPTQRQIVRYGMDESIHVSEFKPWKQPKPYIRQYEIKEGILNLHGRTQTDRDFRIRNDGARPATVVLQVTGTEHWKVDPNATQPVERVGNLNRFEVEAKPAMETVFHFVESHSIASHRKLADLSEQDLRDILTQAGNDPGFTALLKPFLDARKQLADLTRQMQRNTESTHLAEVEESRIRANMAALNGHASDPSLARLYSDEMMQQESKLATLRKEKEEIVHQKHAIEDDMTTKAAALPTASAKLRA